MRRGLVSLCQLALSAALLLCGFALGATSSLTGHDVVPHAHAQDAEQAKAARYWQQLTDLLKPVEMPTPAPTC